MPMRSRDRRPLRGGLQIDITAAEFAGAVGVVVEERRQERAETLRGEEYVFQSGAAVFVEMEFL